MNERNAVMGIEPSGRLHIWRARGLQAGLNSPDFPTNVSFKEDEERRRAFTDGWCVGLFLNEELGVLDQAMRKKLVAAAFQGKAWEPWEVINRVLGLGDNARSYLEGK